jgi:DNA polymerase-3 subunit gamma/tau
VRAFDGDWAGLASRVSVSGLARQFMEQSELLAHDGLSFETRVPIKVLSEASVIGKVRDALSAWFGCPVRLQVTLGSVGSGTAAAQASQQRAERLTKARAELESDPFVQTLLNDFGGRILPESVRPSDS